MSLANKIDTILGGDPKDVPNRFTSLLDELFASTAAENIKTVLSRLLAPDTSSAQQVSIIIFYKISANYISAN